VVLQESDISWQLLRRIVHDWRGTAAELAQVTPLTGGCISTTLALATADGKKAVLKLSPHRVNREYQDELQQLAMLREAGLPVPDVYACKLGTLDDPNSYILLEFIEGVDLAEAKNRCAAEEFDQLQTHLAELVLKLHEQTGGSFKRISANNGHEYASWPQFYREVYNPIWHEAEKDQSLPVKVRKQIHKIHEKLERLIGTSEPPRLLHWDLWSSNLLARPDDQGRWRIAAVLDPNCKYGHAEAEIAYMELFHTVTPAFLKRYQQDHKLSAEYHTFRKPVYQLYTLIDHLLLFGHEYLKPLLAMVDRVGALV
jgi:fructosamine-3-kinase